MKNKTKIAALLLGIFASTLVSTIASAAVITMNCSGTWNGTGPTGIAPWLTATFTDITPGTVQLKMFASALSTNNGKPENVVDWLFNVDPAIVPSHLIFNVVSQVGTFTLPTIAATTQDGQKTQGNVPFDIDFGFATNGVANEFTQGSTLTYNLTDSNAGDIFNASSFAFTTSKGSFGPLYDSAHVQNTGANGSISGDTGATSIPEPTTLGLLALTAFLLKRSKA